MLLGLQRRDGRGRIPLEEGGGPSPVGFSARVRSSASGGGSPFQHPADTTFRVSFRSPRDSWVQMRGMRTPRLRTPPTQRSRTRTPCSRGWLRGCPRHPRLLGSDSSPPARVVLCGTVPGSGILRDRRARQRAQGGGWHPDRGGDHGSREGEGPDTVRGRVLESTSESTPVPRNRPAPLRLGDVFHVKHLRATGHLRRPPLTGH